MGLPVDTFNYLLALEGGYVNDPHDPGGETKYGISRRFLDGIGSTENVKLLTEERAFELYEEHFWDKLQLDKIPFCLADDIFIFAVNAGPGTATKVLQRACNDQRTSRMKALVVDGKLGAKTRKMVNSLARKYEEPLRYAFVTEAVLYYRKLPGYARYKHGWLDRF